MVAFPQIAARSESFDLRPLAMRATGCCAQLRRIAFLPIATQIVLISVGLPGVFHVRLLHAQRDWLPRSSDSVMALERVAMM